MAECPYFEHLLVIPHLRVQNANAISSPLTHGFPSMTAFIGVMWALERKTESLGLDLKFNAVGVVVHNHQEQVTDAGPVKAFRLTRNPVDKDGGTAAIVEEGRIHLEVSLVFALQGESLSDAQTAQERATQVRGLISQMRIAGGTVVESRASYRRQQPYVASLTGDTEGRQRIFDQLKLRLLPGFSLVERQDLLEQRYQEMLASSPQVTRLDAWLSLSRINWRWQTEEDQPESKGKWQHDRKGLGWIVPIPLGYHALGELQEAGGVANVRNRDTPFRFVESLFGVGQWLSPHRLHSAPQFLWYADSQSEEGLYRCRNDYWQQPVDEYNFD